MMMRYCRALAAVSATGFAISGAGSAQDFTAEPGAPAAAFPKTDRPVANIAHPGVTIFIFVATVLSSAIGPVAARLGSPFSSRHTNHKGRQELS